MIRPEDGRHCATCTCALEVEKAKEEMAKEKERIAQYYKDRQK